MPLLSLNKVSLFYSFWTSNCIMKLAVALLVLLTVFSSEASIWQNRRRGESIKATFVLEEFSDVSLIIFIKIYIWKMQVFGFLSQDLPTSNEPQPVENSQATGSYYCPCCPHYDPSYNCRKCQDETMTRVAMAYGACCEH